MRVSPELNERWRAAINPLDYLDFHALSEEAYHANIERLSRWGVPLWAARLRGSIIHAGWNHQHRDDWVPGFALRSEVAMIGRQILSPDTSDQKYLRTYLRFLHGSLTPFVERAATIKQKRLDTLHLGYQGLIHLYGITKNSTWPEDKAWERALVGMEGIRQHLLKTWSMYGLLEALHAVELTLQLGSHGSSWYLDEEATKRTLQLLSRQHQWRLDQNESGELPALNVDTCPHCKYTADAFLTVLEAECPSPDWLPGG